MSYDNLYGMYRGIVTYNTNYTDSGEKEKESDATTELKTDKDLKGRCKVFVYGVYPEKFLKEHKQLPWAEPAYPIFGGNHDSVGINSVPKEGSHVWVFFEQGDYMKPVYSFGCQGGDGWVAEHVNQHIIKTDSVDITIDEDYEYKDGSKTATLNIDVNTPDGNAVNININGNVNLSIVGDVTENINGSLTRSLTGNIDETIDGDVARTITGKYDVTATGNMTLKGLKIDLNP